MLGRKRKPEGEKMKAITFAMPAAEVEEMRKAANRAGERRGEFVRQAVRNRLTGMRMENR